jgi:hypothetical protein
MKLLCLLMTGTWALVLSTTTAFGEIKILAEHNEGGQASAGFKFKNVRPPARGDAAAKATFTIVDGARDQNGGGLDVLHDGKLPAEEDQPFENFFFRAGTDGGRLLIDLGSVIEIKQVNTYSWHAGTRGPQVYDLYASDGKGDPFTAQPRKGTEPEKCGWKRIAKVDTRPKQGEGGGQYGVSISASEGALGQYRYLLFDIFRTEDTDGFGNTFYSEIDVLDRLDAEPVEAPVATAIKKTIEAGGGKYQITVDTTETPDLTEWVDQHLVPVVQEWYPKLVQMLPSEGFEAPKKFTIVFKKDMAGVADTAGTRIRVAAKWFRQNLKGESVGSVVHEMVHVVQQYGSRRRSNPEATPVPGWLTEGLTDYIRFYLYEPQTHGAEITKRSYARAKYYGSYRVTANFLNWVTGKYDKEFVPKLNAIIREGNYNEGAWKKLTGHTMQELGGEWKDALAKQLGIEATPTGGDSKINTLTDVEKAAGWKLLFDGQSLAGWHNFKREGVRPGWQVKDGTLACVDPHNAGDIVTSNQFDWFELQIDYNISEGGNSGIMFHVTDEGGAVWATGPEFQLEDNEKASDPVRCGWLYALYQPPNDPKTGKPLDATKPVGEWNHIRLLISPEKCEHEINGVKYFEYVLDSEDFKSRVAKSKFAGMPKFAKSNTGYLALQGDHGQVSFRNIKIRPIQTTK